MTASQSPRESVQELLRRLPQVDRLLQHPDLTSLLSIYPRQEVVAALRDSLDSIRTDLERLLQHKGGTPSAAAPQVADEAVLDAAGRRLEERGRPRYRRVINGTGIILHTGLGRAVLADAVREALTNSLKGYTIVEVDSASGERNRREGHVVEMLCELTGAEAATVVNNNAAATVIILAALASGKEVILSRGQMVEIGGSFRIPTILEASGARLVEVGTTNRTYVDDYRRVIRPETGLLLSVHTSNYEIAGFSHHTSIEDLAALGRETALPVVSDLGSGCFVDLTEHGFRAEPLVSESVKAGADVVCFSGDKLLGGPQAGILVGRRELIEEIRAHPFFRAMRVDKMTLIALEATLRLYRDPETLAEKLPALGMIELKEPELRKRGDRFRRALLRRLQRGKSHSGKSPQVEVELIKESSQTGSGALPAQDLSTCAAAIALEGLSADELASRLRRYDPPIFTRIRNDRVLIDFRTLLDDEHKTIVEALVKIATSFSKD